MPKNFASASCNKNRILQKITATTENYNGILLCGKTKCTLSAQIPQSKNLLFPVFEDYATENCLLQKFTANNGKLQRHFALRKNKMHVVCTNFTKQENCFSPIFKDFATENCLLQKLLQTTENYNGILLCGKTKCTLSAQISQNKKLAFTVFKRLPRKNVFAR